MRIYKGVSVTTRERAKIPGALLITTAKQCSRSPSDLPRTIHSPLIPCVLILNGCDHK